MIVLCRIDSRLIHGQIIQAWLPHLGAKRIVVADDEAAVDPLARAAYALAVPTDVELVLKPIEQLDFKSLGADDVRTLVLFRDVKGAVNARARGLPDGMLNVGNVHTGPGRVLVSRSVFLDDADARALAALAQGGMTVCLKAVPTEPELPWPPP